MTPLDPITAPRTAAKAAKHTLLDHSWVQHSEELEHELASMTAERDEARTENTYMRGQLSSVKCPYGHKDANGVCLLGYPGCACADDWFAAQEAMHAAMVQRLGDTARKLALCREALETIRAQHPMHRFASCASGRERSHECARCVAEDAIAATEPTK